MVEVTRKRISLNLFPHMLFDFSDSAQVPQFCQSNYEGVPSELPAQL